MAPRSLLLVRHAQAAHGPVDGDRPLTAEGERRAAALGSWLARAGLVPERVIVSPARRAMQTWERAAAALDPRVDPIVDGRLYDNTVEAVLVVVRETSADVRTLAVVGHNPSIGALAGALDDGRGDVGFGFPAGGVAVFGLDTPFGVLVPGGARLRDLAVPGGG